MRRKLRKFSRQTEKDSGNAVFQIVDKDLIFLKENRQYESFSVNKR